MIPVLPSKPHYTQDVAAVAAELANIPQNYAQELANTGIRVVACRDSVVDHLPHLLNVDVRNWPAGSSWKNIPGVYSPGDKTVVIATVAGPGGARRVPGMGERHGSVSLAVHETFHGHDYARSHRKSKNAGFRLAWAADKLLLRDAYYVNDTAGPEESYAESAARVFGRDQRFRTAWPTLTAFWEGPPPGLADDADDQVEDDSVEPEGPSEASVIGIARILDDKSIELDMRAEGPDGLVGHGLIVIGADEDRYERVAGHLGLNDPQFMADVGDDSGALPILPFD
ncbi:MAG TPA: hypothetical protein VN231_03680 [Allosphingosinicella sp.]|nr:hypothetical protein [Allosphingosinicella sp.]